MFCYTDYTREMWNPSVKPTTLAIGLFIDAMHATATAGFTHPDCPDYKRRVMVISLPMKWDTSLDSNTSISVLICKNLALYEEALEELKNHPSITMEELCRSFYAVYQNPWRDLGFWAPPSFSTETTWDCWHKDEDGNYDGMKQPYRLEYSDNYNYDSDSTMYYSSILASEKRPLTVFNAPLVRWVHGGPDYTLPTAVTEGNAVLIGEIPYKRGPSDGDFDGVKRLYPWRGEA
ncbi:hypothetical protein HBI06_173340 [Parastagonospora nodorum]|nr:hypothetical protein HBH42_082020 [Parastagonospora nodorum]KAH4220477.1 hypothetical protein HBI06_173340 [Parastagonospora nodorum]KAH4232779.1 hypothetical protein HBI05_170310 [Parastagonospora nodorum]KAH5534228.1 hypothetical protein HBI27_187020 [Parastagonospora nodorum]